MEVMRYHFLREGSPTLPLLPIPLPWRCLFRAVYGWTHIEDQYCRTTRSDLTRVSRRRSEVFFAGEHTPSFVWDHVVIRASSHASSRAIDGMLLSPVNNAPQRGRGSAAKPRQRRPDVPQNPTGFFSFFWLEAPVEPRALSVLSR